MEAPGPTQVVRQLFDAFDRGDLDGLLATLSPEVRIVYVGANPDPVKAVLIGHERARRFFDGILRRLEVSRFEPVEFVVQGETVVVFGSETGTVRANGAPFHNEWAQKYVVEGGLVRELTEYNIEVRPRAPKPAG